MNDHRADTRRGLPDLVKMLDIILTDSEWKQLVKLIDDYDRERKIRE